jgi:hypothetical protein
LLNRVEADGQEALLLYRDALDRAYAVAKPTQVFHHAINVAFLEWALLNDRAAASVSARTALQACAASPVDKWRMATEGEAAIVLGDHAAALKGHDAAPALGATPREQSSMYQQAMFALDLAENVPLAKELRRRFV